MPHLRILSLVAILFAFLSLFQGVGIAEPGCNEEYLRLARGPVESWMGQLREIAKVPIEEPGRTPTYEDFKKEWESAPEIERRDFEAAITKLRGNQPAVEAAREKELLKWWRDREERRYLASQREKIESMGAEALIDPKLKAIVARRILADLHLSRVRALVGTEGFRENPEVVLPFLKNPNERFLAPVVRALVIP